MFVVYRDHPSFGLVSAFTPSAAACVSTQALFKIYKNIFIIFLRDDVFHVKIVLISGILSHIKGYS